MAELRWVLIILGLAIVAAVYLWGRRRSQSSDADRSARVEPQLSDETDWQPPAESADEPGFADHRTPRRPLEKPHELYWRQLTKSSWTASASQRRRRLEICTPLGVMLSIGGD